MSGIKYECKKAIVEINALIDFYKPITEEGIYDNTAYLQEVKNKVDEIIKCLHTINQLDNTIVTDYECQYSLWIAFNCFNDGDKCIYNRMFLDELIELKEKLIIGCY